MSPVRLNRILENCLKHVHQLIERLGRIAHLSVDWLAKHQLLEASELLRVVLSERLDFDGLKLELLREDSPDLGGFIDQRLLVVLLFGELGLELLDFNGGVRLISSKL